MPKINCDKIKCPYHLTVNLATAKTNCCIDILSLVDGQCEYWKAYTNSKELTASQRLDAMHKDMSSGSYLDQMEHNREARGN